LAQSRRIFFHGSVFCAATGVTLAASVRLFSSAVVEVVAGIVFVLYGKTTIQLNGFHSRLEVLQRYLLANSLCETLDGDERSKARAALIQEISRPFRRSESLNLYRCVASAQGHRLPSRLHQRHGLSTSVAPTFAPTRLQPPGPKARPDFRAIERRETGAPPRRADAPGDPGAELPTDYIATQRSGV
jgi:hypothetical protein